MEHKGPGEFSAQHNRSWKAYGCAQRNMGGKSVAHNTRRRRVSPPEAALRVGAKLGNISSVWKTEVHLVGTVGTPM